MMKVVDGVEVEMTPEEEAEFIGSLSNDPPPRRLIPKSTVQERVNAKGLLGSVFTILQSDPIYFGRWFAPDWPNVYADDQGLLYILATVGMSPEDIAEVTAP